MINKKTIFIVQMLLVFIATVIVSKPLSKIIVWKMDEFRDRKYRWESINKKKYLNPVAWMEIPEIELSTFVVSNPTEKNLSEYPCLADFSAIQTKGMNIVLGHRDMRFFKLRNLEYEHPIKLEFSVSSMITSICPDTVPLAIGVVASEVRVEGPPVADRRSRGLLLCCKI